MRISTELCLCLVCATLLMGCQAGERPPQNLYQSESLTIRQVTEKTYLHVSYLDFNSSKVDCNGLIFIDNGEAVVFDTPTTNEVSRELIEWIESQQESKIKAVVVNHFHADALGGLDAFHQRGIVSIASAKGLVLAEAEGVTVPMIGFEKANVIQVGKGEVMNHYFGSGHTQDNIASYIASENLIYGGCMIKALGAGKGNLADADTMQWATTIKRIKETYPGVQTVVPGHGDPGGVELLDYTIEMFNPSN